MYVIGDLHANYIELEKLIAILRIRKNDKIVFLGDYLDKNIYTKETLKILYNFIKTIQCIFIKGDHEYVWERYLYHKELFRQDFLLDYGSVEAIRQFNDEPEKLIKSNNLSLIKKLLKPYLKLICQCKDYFLTKDYIMMHAGLLPEQLKENPLIFKEINYFVRLNKMNIKKLYLNKHRIIAGHSFLGGNPYFAKGYINVDFGAGYQKYLGALDTKNRIIIRSDGEIFNNI